MSSNTDPARLNHQNAVGTTTCFFFSVAYHWTKNREKKAALPSQPITFQMFHSMPRKLPLGHCRFASQSISVSELTQRPHGAESLKWTGGLSEAQINF